MFYLSLQETLIKSTLQTKITTFVEQETISFKEVDGTSIRPWLPLEYWIHSGPSISHSISNIKRPETKGSNWDPIRPSWPIMKIEMVTKSISDTKVGRRPNQKHTRL